MNDKKLECCPFCEERLLEGHLHGASGRSLIWMPLNWSPDSMILSEKNIHKEGGIVLGEATKIGLFAKRHPIAYRCPNCKALIVLDP